MNPALTRLFYLPTANPARVAQLTTKLAEYRARFDPTQAPVEQMGTFCKVTVLDRLLRDGQVIPQHVAHELLARFGGSFNPLALANACAIIRDYCETGGTHNRGGTGLPPIPTA